MKKQFSFVHVAIACLSTALVTAILFLLIVPNALSGFVMQEDAVSKLLAIKQLVKNNYYTEYDEKALVESMAAGYITALNDPYSYYFSAQQNEAVKQQYKGNAQGIGVNIINHPDTGYIYVVSVATDSPAQKAGIRAGDQITAVNGLGVTAETYNAAVDGIAGEMGTKCRLTLLRDGKESEVSATREEYVNTSVFYHKINTVGYLLITSFNAATVEQFKSAIEQAVDNGAASLIFDVRNNPGGTVDSCIAMLDYILPEGKLMTVKYNDSKKPYTYRSDEKSIDLPMAVLINQNSASAAEVFAAAIRDYNKGKLYGTTSFGKGVMQSTYDLADGSSVRITVATLTPPSGKSYNGVGLVPDKEIGLTDEQNARYYLLSDDEDPVISAAVNALK